MLLPWQMLLPYVTVVDVITTEEDVTSSITARWQMLLPYDIVADVETTRIACHNMLYKRVNNPSLNRHTGKYHLPHIWEEVLFNTSELKIN